MVQAMARTIGFVAGLMVILAGIGVYGGVESDRRLSAFCSSLSPGSRLDDVRTRAAARRYSVIDSAIAHPAIEVFETRTLWPKSWCRLDHDGARITGRTFNPWHE